MAEERKTWARYFYIRGHQTFWQGDAAEDGSVFRTIAIASDQFNSTIGHFQVYALEGIGKGLKNGKFAGVHGDSKVILDEETLSLQEAGERFKEIALDSTSKGFKPFDLWDEIEFEARAKNSQ